VEKAGAKMNTGGWPIQAKLFGLSGELDLAVDAAPIFAGGPYPQEFAVIVAIFFRRRVAHIRRFLANVGMQKCPELGSLLLFSRGPGHDEHGCAFFDARSLRA
jgi:hypothetical protein